MPTPEGYLRFRGSGWKKVAELPWLWRMKDGVAGQICPLLNPPLLHLHRSAQGLTQPTLLPRTFPALDPGAFVPVVMRPVGVETVLIKGTSGSSHTLPQSCCPHAGPDTAPSPGPTLLPWRDPARRWAPSACCKDGHQVGGSATHPEGSCLHPPLLLVYQGAAGLMAAENCLPTSSTVGIAQCSAQTPSRCLWPAALDQEWAPNK